MSKSRSTTPTPNTFVSTNISPSSKSTTSRPQPHENTPPVLSFGEGEQFTLPPPRLFLSAPGTSGHIPRRVRSAESPPSQQPMAKRFRRESPRPRSEMGARSSPSSDSQDGMADTETDVGRNQPTEAPPLAVAPPKKKRTRTLTTPHQSSVLHALLAQSRFPTTAMREEVGRSIGLSARKVQIWFQNQRQKARRPRSQSDISQRPPQYGPFPTGSDPSAVGSFPVATGQGAVHRLSQMSHFEDRGFDDRHQDHSGYSAHHSSESFSSSLDSPSQLLGPGMPGNDLQHTDLAPRSHPRVALMSSDPHDTPSLPYLNPRQHIVQSPSPPRLHSHTSSRPMTTSRLHDRDFSRTLPPLVFNRAQNSASLPAHSIRPSFLRPAATPTYSLQRSSSPESTFAYRLPEAALHSPIPIPPPYTLQPNPRWETSSSFLSTSRPEPSSWSRQTSQSARRSITPPVHSRESTRGAEPESARDTVSIPFTDVASQARSGRYDPVRATFIYTNPTEPSPPPRTSGSGDQSAVEDN